MTVYTNRKKYESPLTTNGDMLIQATSTDTRLPIGTNGQYFGVTTGAPAWKDFTPSGGGGYTHGTKTRTEIYAISSPSQGDTVFCTTFGKPCVYTGLTWQVPGETIEIINNDIINPGAGVIFQVDDSGNNLGRRPNKGANLQVLGPVVFSANVGNWMSVAVKGIWMAYVGGSINAGDFIQTNGGVTGGAKTQGVSPGIGAFGICLQSGGDAMLDCSIYAPELK